MNPKDGILQRSELPNSKTAKLQMVGHCICIFIMNISEKSSKLSPDPLCPLPAVSDSSPFPPDIPSDSEVKRSLLFLETIWLSCQSLYSTSSLWIPSYRPRLRPRCHCFDSDDHYPTSLTVALFRWRSGLLQAVLSTFSCSKRKRRSVDPISLLKMANMP